MYKNYSYSIGILDAVQLKLFLLRIVIWSYDCLLSIIINYLKPYNYEQTKNNSIIETFLVITDK